MIPVLSSITKSGHRRGKQNHFIIPVAGILLLFLVGQAYWLSKNKQMFRPFSIVKIDCDECRKLGIVRDEKDNRISRMCPGCYGVGYHTIRIFDEDEAICPACAGLGRHNLDGNWRTCERCEGRGVFRLGEWSKVTEAEPASESPSSENHQPSTSSDQEPASPDSGAAP